MKKHLIPFFLFLFLFISCNNTSNKDKIVQKIYKYHKKIENNNDSAFYYLREAKKLIDNYPNFPDTIKAKNNYLFGKYFNSINQLDSTYHYYNNAINSIRVLNSDKEKQYFLDLAYVYKKNGDFLNSLSTLDKLESITLKQKDYKTLAEINNQKQSIYILLKNYKKALTYNKKAIANYTLAKDTSNLINNLILQSSYNYYNFKNKKETYKLLDSILTINLKGNKYSNILTNQIYQNYGIFKYYDKEFSESYKYYLKAISYLNKPKTKADSINLANTYANISEVCIDLKKYQLAKKYIDSVEQLSSVLNQNLNTFHLQNKLRLSFKTNKEFTNISKSFNELTKTMNTNYEKKINNELNALKIANKKEKELLISNQNILLKNEALKQKQIIGFSILGFIFLIGFQYYRHKKHIYEKEEIFLNQRLFRAQMNPHFTSNILYSIQDLILDNKEKANKYLIKFSRLIRLNLENSMHNYTSLEKEIELLTKYLDLQQLSFQHSFEYQINTNDIETDIVSIPPMLIQPFVENAIEHGFKNIDYKGFLQINLTEKEKYIFCQIIDNGVGLSKDNNKTNHNSASTILIKRLLKKMINQDVKIYNNPNKKGTIVEFNIPFK